MTLTLAAAVVGTLIVAAITFANPRYGSYIFWTLTWCYPTSLLHGMLPLSIRFDDLFIIYLSFCCLRQMPPDVFKSRMFKVAMLWFISIAMGNLVGLATGPGYMFQAVLKEVGKASYIVMIVFVVRCTVRSETDVRNLLIALFIGATGTLSIGITQVYAPGLVSMWETPTESIFEETVSERDVEDGEETRRAAGSMGGTVLSIIGMGTTILGLRLGLNVKSLQERAIMFGMAGIGALGLGYTITRGAIAGLLGGLAFSLFACRKRGGMLVLLLIGGVLITTQTDIVGRVMNRIIGSAGQVNLDESASGRTELWWVYLSEFSLHYFFFGRGFTAEYIRHGTASVHSSYIGAISYTGLFGCCVLLYMIFKMFKLARDVYKVETDPMFLGLAEAGMCLLVAIMINGVTAEIMQKPLPILFTVMTLLDIRYDVICRYWASLAPPTAVQNIDSASPAGGQTATA